MSRILPVLVLLAAAPLARPESATPASKAPAAAAPGGRQAGAPAAGHVVVLKDGTRIDCSEPPLIALGRVLYRTADGARHAVPADRVDLEKTRPSEAKISPPAPEKKADAGDPAARREAPDFTATRADGTKVKLSELRGKVVLVDFWATWCGPCVAEMPNVKRLYAKHAGPHFEIVGVSLDRSRVELEAFMKAQGITWPQAFDGKGWENAVARQYGVSSIPVMLLLDRDGRVARAGIRGPLLEQAVADVLAETPSKSKPKAT